MYGNIVSPAQFSVNINCSKSKVTGTNTVRDGARLPGAIILNVIGRHLRLRNSMRFITGPPVMDGMNYLPPVMALRAA